jgi:hypothetical protein
MPPTASLISTDCSSATVFTDTEDHTFSAPAIDGEPDAPQLQRRAIELAAWAAKLPAVRRKLPMLCLDVEETTCAWLRAPSHIPQVLNASFRNLMQEWGDAAAGQSIVPLDDQVIRAAKKPAFTLLPKRKSKNTPNSAVRAAVLCQPDALARIVLGALDKQGLRPQIVTTLWHAAAAAWCTPGDPLTAVVVERSPGRFIWVWCADASPIAAGHMRAAVAHEEDAPDRTIQRAVAQRLAMDFTAWATHLGCSPKRITVVAADPSALSSELAAVFTDAPAPDEIATDRPVRDTLMRALDAPAQTRKSLPIAALTNRPTRAMRNRVRLSAATLFIAAIAAAGFAYQLAAAASEQSRSAANTRTGSIQQIRDLNDPEIVGPNFARTLESRLIALRNKPSLKTPPAPLPIFEELAILVDVVNSFDDVTIKVLNIDSARSSRLDLTVPDRRTGTAVRVELQARSNNLVWEQDSRGSNRNEKSVHLTGTWKR